MKRLLYYVVIMLTFIACSNEEVINNDNGNNSGNTTPSADDIQRAAERDALIAFYNATGGENWENNTNWCSDRPVNEWYGVQLDYKGMVRGIRLTENNLSGEVNDELDKLSSLESLVLYTNQLTSLNVSNLANLVFLNCDGNQLTELNITSSNNLLDVLSCANNKLTALDVSNLTKLTVLNCGNNKLTALDVSDLTKLTELHCDYNQISELDIRNLSNLIDLNCSHNQISELDMSNLEQLSRLVCGYNPITVLDLSNCPDLVSLSTFGTQNLKIIITREQKFDYNIDGYTYFVYKGEDQEMYTSTDFSRDGEVKQLQQATIGNGIDIILMGDAYSDRLIEDGTYEKIMKTAMQSLFWKEPYKSFRNYFNVYYVTVVSANEVYREDSSTALGCNFGDGTVVGGDDETAIEYALKVVDAEKMDYATIVVMMNDESRSGTCYMYKPETASDWGNGLSVSYFPLGQNNSRLIGVLNHEVCGHGFAKLADEYVMEEYENYAVSENNIAWHNYEWETYGWWKNIDFTTDTSLVKWSHFLADARYKNEGLGIYEGALYCGYGAYRPNQTSIMRQSTIEYGFNAPSREAIYYRIHKLAFGAEWEYDYEEFVEWDAINRNTAATRVVPYRLDKTTDLPPLPSPVVMNKTWREAR